MSDLNTIEAITQFLHSVEDTKEGVESGAVGIMVGISLVINYPEYSQAFYRLLQDQIPDKEFGTFKRLATSFVTENPIEVEV